MNQTPVSGAASQAHKYIIRAISCTVGHLDVDLEIFLNHIEIAAMFVDLALLEQFQRRKQN